MEKPRSNSWKGQTLEMEAAAVEASRQLATKDALAIRLYHGVSAVDVEHTQ